MNACTLWTCSICRSRNILSKPAPMYSDLDSSGAVTVLKIISKVSAASFVSNEVPCKRRMVARGNLSWKRSIDVPISKIRANGIRPCHDLLRFRRLRILFRYDPYLRENFDNICQYISIKTLTMMKPKHYPGYRVLQYMVMDDL